MHQTFQTPDFDGVAAGIQKHFLKALKYHRESTSWRFLKPFKTLKTFCIKNQRIFGFLKDNIGFLKDKCPYKSPQQRPQLRLQDSLPLLEAQFH